MKNKLLILILFLGFLLFVGCKPKVEDEKFIINQALEEISVTKVETNEIYSVNKTDNFEETTAFVSNLEKIRFNEIRVVSSDTELDYKYDYIIQFDSGASIKINKEVFVLTGHAYDLNDGFVDVTVNKVTKGSFDFLNELEYVKIEEYKQEILPYAESDLEEILLTIISKERVLDLSNNNQLRELLLTTKFYRFTEKIEPGPREAKYVLMFGNHELTIYDNGYICYAGPDTEIDYLFTLNNEFDYLDTLYESDTLDFNKYTDTQTIKVYNSKNDSVEITEKTDFLNKLKQVKYFKLNNKENFELGDLKYKIQIDEEIINVYSIYMVINDNLYIISEGNFSFLNDIKFSSSSGWLPWL